VQSQLHTEPELLAELAAGGRIATEKIYNQYYNTITKWIQNYGGTRSDADDIYQEAIIILYEKAQGEDFRLSCRIGTYLFAISKHLWYKRIQKIQKQPSYLPDGAGNDDRLDWAYDDDINAHAERENHYQQLDQALEQLGEPCSSLLKAYYHHDKSMQEIAADFGYTNPDNAKTQKYKCLARLRKIFYGAQAKL
jgi:RNA polymerase sigma factor (sigma-70 family)